MKYTVLLIIMLFFTAFAKAEDWQKTPLGIKVSLDTLTVEIQFYSPSTVRIVKVPVNNVFNKKSLSVIAKPQKVSLKTSQSGNVLFVKSDKIRIAIDLKTAALEFSDSKGNTLLSEKERGAKFDPFNDTGNQTFSVSQRFVLEPGEAIYGLGQQQNGRMIQQNFSVKMVQGNTDDYSPFFQSVKGYGVFWDNYSPTLFKDQPTETSLHSEVGEGIDYYFLYGGNADGVIWQMRELTGRAPMFPLWTYGFWQSKERYKSQDELVGVVKKYRELQVPLDGIIQDWQYWGNNYLWNAMEFLNPEFYNPKKMIDDVHQQNAHIIISTWSSFGPHTKPYKELNEKGLLFNFKTWPESGSEKWPPNLDYPSGVRVYDAYSADARDIYWKYLNQGVFSLGMDGWWMDSTEPDHLSFQPSDFDTKTSMGSFRKVRNAYPLMTVGGVYDHQRSVSRDKRVFILTRSAFAGQQRYGANTWSGDVTASWDALRNQISAGLNFSLTGMPYWNSDIGGFFLSKFPKKLSDPEYRELYVRWLQFGTFCPMMRSHGADAPREIYQFGKKGEQAYDAIEKFIRLRYNFLPYIYSTSWDVTAKHSSMMRALMMDFSTDQNALDINDQFMFGKSILVSPVTKAMYVQPVDQNEPKLGLKEDFSQKKSRELYLPKGADWYDYWTGEKISGGQKIVKESPLNIIPLHVKAGSILPFGQDVQYATEKNWDNLEIRIYPGSNAEFDLYEDENDNYNYENGAYSTIKFEWNDAKRTLTVNARKGDFKGMLLSRKFKVNLAGDENKPEDKTKSRIKTISYSGKRMIIEF
jgi:alpha-D-xyloside xylohydrolase